MSRAEVLHSMYYAKCLVSYFNRNYLSKDFYPLNPVQKVIFAVLENLYMGLGKLCNTPLYEVIQPVTTESRNFQCAMYKI